MDSEIRKDIVLMILMSQRPPRVTVTKAVDLNLHAFNVVRTRDALSSHVSVYLPRLTHKLYIISDNEKHIQLAGAVSTNHAENLKATQFSRERITICCCPVTWEM